MELAWVASSSLRWPLSWGDVIEGVVRRLARADLGAGVSDGVELSSLGRFKGLVRIVVFSVFSVSTASGPGEDREAGDGDARSIFGIPAAPAGSFATAPSSGAMSMMSI